MISSSAERNLRGCVNIRYLHNQLSYTPSCILTKFPKSWIKHLWFGPYSAAPLLPNRLGKCLVTKIPDRNCNEIGWNCHGLSNFSIIRSRKPSCLEPGHRRKPRPLFRSLSRHAGFHQQAARLYEPIVKRGGQIRLWLSISDIIDKKMKEEIVTRNVRSCFRAYLEGRDQFSSSMFLNSDFTLNGSDCASINWLTLAEEVWKLLSLRLSAQWQPSGINNINRETSHILFC